MQTSDKIKYICVYIYIYIYIYTTIEIDICALHRFSFLSRSVSRFTPHSNFTASVVCLIFRHLFRLSLLYLLLFCQVTEEVLSILRLLRSLSGPQHGLAEVPPGAGRLDAALGQLQTVARTLAISHGQRVCSLCHACVEMTFSTSYYVLFVAHRSQTPRLFLT